MFLRQKATIIFQSTQIDSNLIPYGELIPVNLTKLIKQIQILDLQSYTLHVKTFQIPSIL